MASTTSVISGRMIYGSWNSSNEKAIRNQVIR
jgi:hypothetical protein